MMNLAMLEMQAGETSCWSETKAMERERGAFIKDNQ